MKFREVAKLSPNTKYKIISTSNDTYVGIYVHTKYINQLHLHRFTISNKTLDFLSQYYLFYEPIFQAERIQSAMEHRAVNLILRRVIGDESFTW